MVLVAYVVVDTASAASSERARTTSTRRHMTEHLPDYMVPAIYVELDHLPLNHNMKVDRRALVDPRVDLAEGDARSIREPETDTERVLATIWKRVLGVPEVGLDDNFFELGGFSLLASGLILEVENALGVTLDGMDVLRESLEVLARICDERLGKKVDRFPAAPLSRTRAALLDHFHFGAALQLHGVLRSPLRGGGGGGEREVVVVCAPVGQERLRAHFILNRLAVHLVERGVSVFQFDYSGCGDSLGDSADAGCTKWREDITDALGEIQRRFGGARITAVGVRLGATLLWDMADHLDVARLVLWDPVCDGSEHVEKMVAMHRRYLAALERPWFRLVSASQKARRSQTESSPTELLGLTYSAAALADLKRLAMAPRATERIPIRWLATSPSAREKAAVAAIVGTRPDSRFEVLDVDCFWQDVARFEDILPDVGIAKGLARMVTERP
jgi:hypothetical protein